MVEKLTIKKRGNSAVLFEEEVAGGAIVTVGSDPGSTILLSEDGIAPEQFVLLQEGSNVILMNRADGTALNGELLSPGGRASVTSGDLISVADFQLFFGEGSLLELEQDMGLAAGEGGPAVKAETGAVPKPLAEVAANGEASSIEPDDGEKDFSDILYGLKAEDVFCFHLEDEKGVSERIPFENDQIWLGTISGRISFEPAKENLEEVFARISKDWSGVVVYPRDDQQVLLNGELVAKPERLSNRDRLVLIDDFDEVPINGVINFQEPVSMLALSSILPGELPEPVVASEKEPVKLEESEAESSALQSKTDAAEKRRLVFGYFTKLEILFLVLMTFVAAALVFLVLEMA
ncbi:MAG: FHA domain-containing protein [Pyrinomonadaceae bacterium]